MKDETKSLIINEITNCAMLNLNKMKLSKEILFSELLLDKSQNQYSNSNELLGMYLKNKSVTACIQYFCDIEKRLNIDTYHFNSNKDLVRKIESQFSMYFNESCIKKNSNVKHSGDFALQNIVQHTFDYFEGVIYPSLQIKENYNNSNASTLRINILKKNKL